MQRRFAPVIPGHRKLPTAIRARGKSRNKMADTYSNHAPEGADTPARPEDYVYVDNLRLVCGRAHCFMGPESHSS